MKGIDPKVARAVAKIREGISPEILRHAIVSSRAPAMDRAFRLAILDRAVEVIAAQDAADAARRLLAEIRRQS